VGTVQIFARKRLVQNVRIFKQAGSLARAGYDVTVVGVADGSSPRQAVKGFTIVRVPVESERSTPSRPPDALVPRARRLLREMAFPLRWLAYYRGAYRYATTRATRPDVVHCNDLDSLPVGLLVARRYGVPVVYDIQDLYPEQDHVPPWLGKLMTLLERRLIRRVQRVCVVNDAMAQVVARRYHVTVDAVVLNCPPLHERANRRPHVRQALRIGDEQTVLVYSGSLQPHRGLDNVILSLRHLDDDVTLVLLGEGPLRTHLEQVAAGAGLRDRVLFHDFVAHLDVPAFLASADIGIVPYEHVGLNHYLCSPSKLFHYIMAELPVVCSDFPFLRRVVIGTGIGATFDPARAGSIAGAIREVSAMRRDDDGLGERLRTLKHRYCWEEEEQRLLGLYDSLQTGNRKLP
jgi:glycosyltransferase involved in cell wall biosynthesis